MNELEKKTGELRRASNRQRISVIETDIDTGMTFLQLADTELGMGNMERVHRLIGLARKAHEATGKFLTRVPDPETLKGFARNDTDSKGRSETWSVVSDSLQGKVAGNRRLGSGALGTVPNRLADPEKSLWFVEGSPNPPIMWDIRLQVAPPSVASAVCPTNLVADPIGEPMLLIQQPQLLPLPALLF